MSSSEATVKRIVVTGAAGQIGYSLVFAIASGQMLGPKQAVILHLLDIPACEPVLNGVVMELEDGAFPLLHGIVATADVETAFRDVDIAVLVGAMPRKEGMERADLLKANAGIFKVQGAALGAYAKPGVKVLVVGNPANTNALLTLESSNGKLKPSQVSALTRLDHNRAIGALAKRLGGSPSSVKNVIIWGNHSATQYPDVTKAVFGPEGKSVYELVKDDEYLQGPFVKLIQQRGAAVIAARKLSSAASAAKAICDHIHDWVLGTPEGTWVSMGVPSDGSYDIAPGVIYSFPVTCKDGEFHIVQGLEISEFSRKLMTLTDTELRQERATALSFLGSAL